MSVTVARQGIATATGIVSGQRVKARRTGKAGTYTVDTRSARIGQIVAKPGRTKREKVSYRYYPDGFSPVQERLAGATIAEVVAMIQERIGGGW